MAGKKTGTVVEVSGEELARHLSSPTSSEDPPMDSERRTETRHSTRWEVEVPLATWDQARRVYTVNISRGGLMFSVVPPARVPATLELLLTLPDGQKVRVPSEVRHLEPAGNEYVVGVQFQLDEEGRSVLDKALGEKS